MESTIIALIIDQRLTELSTYWWMMYSLFLIIIIPVYQSLKIALTCLQLRFISRSSLRRINEWTLFCLIAIIRESICILLNLNFNFLRCLCAFWVHLSIMRYCTCIEFLTYDAICKPYIVKFQEPRIWLNISPHFNQLE